MDTTWLNDSYFGNPLFRWIICGSIIVLTLLLNGLIAKIASRISYRIFRKISHAQYYEEFSRLFQKPFVQVINLLALYAACNQLNFPAEWELVKADEFGLRWFLHTIYTVVLLIAITRLFLKATEFMEYVYHNLENSSLSKDLATFLKELTRVLIYVVSFFAILSKAFEVNIMALIASLGIGGLAIALAAQDTLANLISSFIIYLDKPFQVGEIIELGEVKGVVEKIGFRTTRIRTMDRSLLIVPNKKIIDSNLNNITQSSQRRVKFNISLTFQTTPDQIKLLMEEIRKAIAEEQPFTHDEITVRFTDFEHSSLNLLVIFYVNSNDYDDMIEVKERINLKIMDIIHRSGCQFAYPSQTVFLQK